MENKKKKYLLGGLLYSGAKAFGANDTIANSLGALGGVGESFFNPIGGIKDAAQYGTKLIPELMAYGGQRKQIYSYGGFNEYNGPKHEEGGVNISPVAETEGGENEYKGYIYSNRVKHDNKSTFAEEASKIHNKYKKRLKDELSIESMEREFKALEMMQESHPEIIKGRESVNQKYAFGGNGDPLKNTQFQTNNPNNSYLNPLDLTGAGMYGTPNSLALDAGLEIPQAYETPGLPPFMSTIERAKAANPNAAINYSTSDAISTDRINNKDYGIINPETFDPSTSPFTSPNTNGLLKSRSVSLPNSNPPILKHSTNPQPSVPLNNNFPDTNISPFGAILNSIGPASQLIGTLKNGPDQTNFDRVNPELVNFGAAVESAKNNASLTRGNMRSGVTNNARSSGQLLSNLVAGDVAIGSDLGNTVAGIKMNENNTNTGIKNQAQQTNAQIQMQEKIANEQNKAAYRQAIYGALTDMGNIGAGYMKDNAMLDSQTTQNNRTLNMLSGLPSRYTIDANGNIIVK